MLGGTPGVGKSTIGARVAELLGLEAIEVRSLAGGSVEVDLRSLSARCGAVMRRASRPSLLITHIIFKPRGVDVKKAVVLRKDPLLLYEELKARGYDESKVLENVEAELIGTVYYDAVTLFGEEKVCQIDVTEVTADETCWRVIRCLECVHDTDYVDWMGKLEREGRIERLLTMLSRRS